MNLKNSQWLPILGSLVFFAAIAVFFTLPVFTENQALSQGDIIQYRGGAQEMYNFQKSTGEKVYWTNSMFGGMPLYQAGARYDYNFLQQIDQHVIRFLPRPADYIFLLLSGFFFLSMVLFRHWKYALLGAVMFGLGTYFFIIIEAGHNSKVHAIAYFAPLMASILLIFRGKYLTGLVLTTIFMALQIAANHPQMTYYFGFVVLFYLIFELVRAIRQQQIPHFLKAAAFAFAGLVLAIGINSTPLLATYDYGERSIRGQNDITLLQGAQAQGLEKDYITQWSYGVAETMNLWIPNFMGGGSMEPDTYKTQTRQAIERNVQTEEEYNYLMQVYPYLSTYWGQQPFTSGPAYQGAVVVFLFILALFVVRGRYKWWLLAATILSIVLAWGKNFMPLTDFFIDYIPLYNKFRAVSSILVIAEFAMPLLAAIGVYIFFTDAEITHDQRQKYLLFAGGGTLAFLLLFYFMAPAMFSFGTAFDMQLPDYLRRGITADRIAMFRADTLRSLIFGALVLGLLLLWHFSKFTNRTIIVLSIALLSLIDLSGVNKRYLNAENFIPKAWVDNPFPTQMSERMLRIAQQGNPTVMQIAHKIPYNQAVQQISAQDPGHYRVFNMAGSTFNETNTSYYASSIGGYHGVKLRNFQNIIDVYFSNDSVQDQRLGVRGQMQNILHMLNTKYVIAGSNQEPQVMPNPQALGNAWFVPQVQQIDNADQAILAIGSIDASQTAITATPVQSNNLGADGSITLTSYHPDRMVYQSSNTQNGFGVFSEIFYDGGWTATINGQPTPIIKTNYFLRGLEIPAGENEIIFTFDPPVLRTGGVITLISYAILLAIVAYWAYLFYTDRKRKSNQDLDN
ncbi:MAG: YfhO family protein [Weeksellaceae bacterium]|nr:YfhO family protein [Weeksellaceae bacterium]